MPSGAKKRKAARRKKEMGIHPPDSPSNPSRGDGESQDSKGESSDEGEEKKSESPRSESITVAAMDGSENGKEKLSEDAAKVSENPPVEEKEKVVEEETVAILVVVREAEDVSIELAQSEKVEVDGGEAPTEVAEEKSATVASVVHVEEPVSVTEEVSEATEAAAVTSEASLVVDALAHQREAKPVPIFDTPPAPVIERPQARESGEELCDGSERSEAARGPLIEHRATWWNCCGLFDVFKSSGVAT